MTRIFTPLLLAGALAASAATYEIDPAHSSAQFSVKHLMVSNVRGEFAKISGSLEFNDNDPAGASVKAKIEAGSINTRVDKRDEHLKSPDFFDVAKFPAITFESKSFRKVSPGKYKVSGDLTIRGVTRRVDLDVDGPTQEVKDPWGNVHIGATATTAIKRTEFGLIWNKALEAGGVLVGDDVNITLDLEFQKKNATVSSAAH